ncbi:MAG: polysaccharide deacetylase family protein, partial [Chloroflexota bacterium]|nr:polysaccharide deacetylase family protein [Chloroflexota bacterium]
HSWSHPNLALLSGSEIVSQINLTSDTIQQAIGIRPTFFRPPYGVFNTRVLTKVNLLSLTTIIWNDEARDWTMPGTDVIVNRILNLAGDGAIILLHDGGGDRSQTIAALPTIITTLRSRGFQFVTMQQMLKDMPERPASTQAPVSKSTPLPTATSYPTQPPTGSPTP